MKTIKFFAIAAAAAAVFACKSPTEYEKLVTEAENNPEVKALAPTADKMDSVSYLFGVNVAMQLKGQGFFDDMAYVSMSEFQKGMEDAFKAGRPEQGPNPYVMYVDSAWAEKFKVSPYEINKIFTEYLEDRAEYKAKLNEEIGKIFLADNAKKSGVKVTESGLQYILHAEGEGAKIMPEDRVVVNYKGTLINGTQFDANDGVTFNVNQVIPGWIEGLCLLGKGGKATLYIPAELGYGENAPRGSLIEPNSTLIFEVEIVDVIKPVVEPVEAVEAE